MKPTLLLALVGLAAGSTFAEDDECCSAGMESAAWLTPAEAALGFDEVTGRLSRNYAADRAVDHEHMRLRIMIPDMNTPRATCEMDLTLRAIAKPVSSFSLDARAMVMKGVACEGHTVSFDHDGRELTIHLSPPLDARERATVTIAYDLNDPPRGLIWTPESDRYPGRPPQIHTQGQTNTNSYWFPCHDKPDEKLTTEVVATVPAGFIVSSNGTLQSRTTATITASGPLHSQRLQPAETFHFVQDKPHAAYLVSLVVGKFDVVDVAGLADAGGRRLSMPVYVPVGRGEDARKTYKNTPAMVRLYERLFDEPYPWSKYAQLVVHNFEAGGMENTSATSMHDNAVTSDEAREDYDLDGLISHELGHQWFGDLTTCRTWDQIWLNEGFATYSTNLWWEERDGPDRYDEQVREQFDRVLTEDKGVAPGAHAMISKVYDQPFENFRRPGNPYPKGASILHMLRRDLGDEAFFGGIRDFIDARKFDVVETYQLRQAFERRSGRQLERFFEQWTLRPGTPTVAVSWTYDPQRKKLRFTVEQKQQVDADNPTFEFALPIFVRNSAGPDVMIEPFLFAKSDTFEVELEGPPRFVAVDPDQHVLARLEVAQDPAMWLRQAQDGPTLIARVMAVRALAPSNEAVATEYLRRLASDESEKKFLRTEAVKTLAKRGNTADMRTLVSSARDLWEVRLAVTEGLVTLAESEKGKADASLRDFVSRTLAARAATDDSLRVRCAAVRGIGKLKLAEHETLVRQALQVSSQSDDMRQAGLDALTALRTPDALDVMIAFAQEGADNRTRSAAIECIGKIAKEANDADKTKARAALAALLATRSARPRMSAAEALADSGDPAAVEVLGDAMKNAPAPELAARIRQQKEKLEKKLAETK